MLQQQKPSQFLDVLPDNTIEDKLVNVLNISRTDSRYIVRQMRYRLMPSDHRIEQAIILLSVCNEVLDGPISVRKISKVCNCDHSKVSKRIRSTNPNGRPTKLNPDQEEELIYLIQLYTQIHRPVSASFLRQYILDQFGIVVSTSWHHRFLSRHHDKIRMDIAIPQDSKRIQVPREFAENHIKNMIDYVKGTPTKLVFNIDEVGCQKWADRKEKQVIVSQTIPKGKVFYSIKRCEKRVSIVSAINLAGDKLVLMIISQRKTIDIIKSGLREGEDYLMEYQKSAFINKEIFRKYIQLVIFKYIDEIRKNPQYEKETSVILCDNCSAHVDDDLYQEMKNRNIRFITFPPHSSHLFQPLDLVTFGVFKMHLKSITGRIGKSTQASTIKEILRALELAMISDNNRAAFKRAGLKIDPNCSPNRCIINEKKLHQRIDDAGLQSCGSNSGCDKFGFMNKKYF